MGILILTMLPFPGVGAAYGTAKAGIGIAGVGTFRPDLIMKACYHTLPFDLCVCVKGRFANLASPYSH